jgi:hypothetical protein
LLPGWQGAGRQCNHDCVIARQNDVDPDNFEQTNPEIHTLKQVHPKSPAVQMQEALKTKCSERLLLVYREM